MALVVNSNVSSLMAQKSLNLNQSSLSQAMERLSSGKRINSAADDAAGLSIASRMTAQIRGLDQAVKNANDGISLVQAADGAMDEISSMLQRMRELSVQATNGTLTSDDRANLQAEVAQLNSEIDRIVDSSTFNEKTLLDGSYQTNLQIGMDAGQTLNVDIANMGTLSLGGISGSSSGSAITKASMAGTEATATTTRLDFTSNDNYDLTLSFEVDGKTYMYTVDAEVENGSAKQIADAINDSLTGKPDGLVEVGSAAITGTANTVADLSSVIEVSYVGRQLTLKNLQGGDIRVDAGTTMTKSTSTIAITGSVAAGGGQIYVSSVSGGTGSQSGLIGDSRFASTSLENSNTTAFASAVAAASAVAGVAVVDFGGTVTFETGDTIKVVVDGVSATTASGTASGAAAMVTAIKTALSGSSLTGYTFAASGTALTITKADGTDFSFDVTAVTGGATVGTYTVADTGATAVSVTGTAGAVVNISGGTAAVSASSGSPGGVLTLDLLAADDYEFTFATTAGVALTSTISVSYDGTSASLSAAAATINAGLSSATTNYDFTVSVADGRIKITEKNGVAYKLSNFASDGAGRVVASVGAGQGVGGVDAVILDDTSYANNFTTNGNGQAVATDIDLGFFGETDTYSFEITDGTATAVVTATKPTETAGQFTSAAQTMYNAVKVALAQAGLDDTIDVAKTAFTGTDARGDFRITLTHKLGSEVTIQNMKSDGDGQILVSAGANTTTGTSAYLNDNLGGNSPDDVIANISVATASGASDALAVLDRAIADVDSQRSKLGAIENRLDHTVNNLTNISVNTSAARSRIQDADYAVEAANLAKSQVMQQAGAAMLAQANASSQIVLTLLG